MSSTFSIVVEGWRGVPHSYAIVNGFQCLELLAEPKLALRHVDLPFPDPGWRRAAGVFAPTAEAAINGIPPPHEGSVPDAVFRISYPYPIRPSQARKTIVFGTSEYQRVPDSSIAGGGSLFDACKACDALIVTPSNWSREGFLRSGAPPHRVKLLSHGVDTTIFHPIANDARAAMRAAMGWSGFVFLSLGAMSGNKGIKPLLKALAVVAGKYPGVRLMLKGVGAIYRSLELFQQCCADLTTEERGLIQPRVGYLDRTLSFAEMATLYQAADAYVSPYLAEGFNLPVLEAIASGLPVICTEGGPTDEFTTEDFALRVRSVRTTTRVAPGMEDVTLRVDVDHLVHQMITAVELSALGPRARAVGPAFVAAGHTWAHVARRLTSLVTRGE